MSREVGVVEGKISMSDEGDRCSGKSDGDGGRLLCAGGLQQKEKTMSETDSGRPTETRA
jgi:hypothetical protein